MNIHGRCHCGRVSYEAEIDPARVSLCHCTDCQVFSGSPWRASAYAAAADVTFGGEPATIYVKTAASGRARAQGFCGTCGSAMFSTTPTDREAYWLRLGAIAERAELPPQEQVWCDSALPWASDLTDVPRGGPSKWARARRADIVREFEAASGDMRGDVEPTFISLRATGAGVLTGDITRSGGTLRLVYATTAFDIDEVARVFAVAYCDELTDFYESAKTTTIVIVDQATGAERTFPYPAD